MSLNMKTMKFLATTVLQDGLFDYRFYGLGGVGGACHIDHASIRSPLGTHFLVAIHQLHAYLYTLLEGLAKAGQLIGIRYGLRVYYPLKALPR